MWFDSWESVLRIVVHGSLGYIALVFMLRLSGKRTLSKMNAFDFVVTIAIGSLFATVLIDENVSLVTGVTAFAVLIFAQFIITWLSARSTAFEHFVKAEPTLLYHDGEMLRRALRRMRITEREVEAMVRRAGIPNMDAASAVVLEADGSVSVMSSDIERLELPNVSRQKPPNTPRH